MSRIRINLDALGVCASTLCMIHCLALPLLLDVLPLWKLSSEDNSAAAARRICLGSPKSKHILNPNPFL